MEFIIWKKDVFGDLWARHDVDSGQELEVLIIDLLRTEGEIIVTEPRDYRVSVKVLPAPVEKEPKEPKSTKVTEIEPRKEETHGAEKSKPEKDRGPKGKGNGKV